jgi:hypothetical protein
MESLPYISKIPCSLLQGASINPILGQFLHSFLGEYAGPTVVAMLSENGAGRVQSTGRVNFHFEDPRFLTALTGYVPILSTMCLDCGIIDLSGDVSKARKISKQNKS